MTNKEMEVNVEPRLVGRVYSNLIAYTLLGIVVAVMLAGSSYLLESGLHAFFWLINSAIVFLSFALISERYSKDEERQSRAAYWYRVLLAVTLAGGFNWGLAAWLLFVDQGLIAKFFLYTVLISVAAVSVSFFAARLSIFLAFCLPMLGLMAIEAARHEEYLLVFSLLVCFLAAALSRVAWRFGIDAKSAVLLELENERLRGQVEDAREAGRMSSEAELKAHKMMESSGVMSWQIDRAGLIVAISHNLRDLTGLLPADLLGQPLVDFFKDLTRSDLPHSQLELLLGQRRAFRDIKFQLECGSGTPLVLLGSAKPRYCDDEFAGFDGFFRDVTGSHNTIKQLTYASQHDPITGLINRLQFLEQIDVYVPPVKLQGRIPHVMYINVQNMRVVNDNLGLASGDEMFCELAATLRQEIAASGTVARLGGGVFGVLLQPGDLAGALQTASKAVASLTRYRFERDGLTLSIQVRAGIVGITPKMDTAEEVLNCADLACRHSKPDDGEALVLYHPDMQLQQKPTASQQVAKLISDLDNDRLCLQLQPIIDLHTRKTVWLEALLGSKNEAGEVTLVGNSLAAAEKHGVIRRFDHWVVDAALNLLAGNQQLGSDGLFINVSVASLQDRSFTDYVFERLQTYGVDARRICFDVTASTDVSDHKVASENLQKLEQRGCQVALDDFGTGTSSLENFKRLPANFIKINHVFLDGIKDNDIDRNICCAIVELAQRSGCRVIAESVQDTAILPLLIEYGITFAQGYALGGPANLADIPGCENTRPSEQTASTEGATVRQSCDLRRVG